LGQLDEDFIKVRDFLEENPNNQGVAEIVEVTGVSKEHVMYLLRSDRLVTAAPVLGGIQCQMCHKPISAGTLCESCRIHLSSTLQKTVPPPPQKSKEDSQSPGARMHTRGLADKLGKK